MLSRGTTAARTRAVGVSVGVALLLAACTSGGSSGPTPPTGIGTVTPRPTPTASPTPTEAPAPETIPPERPAALDDPNVEGAEALARYFLDLYGYAYATGDLAEWERLSHPDCVFCASTASGVREMHGSGNYTRGLGTSWQSIDAEHLGESRFAVEGVLVEDPARVYGPDDSLLSEADAPQHFDVVFALDGADGWSVLEVDILAREDAQP